MVVVAVVAVLIGTGLELHRRSRRFESLAGLHSRVAMEHFSTLLAFGGDPPPLKEIEEYPPAAQGPVRYLHRAKSLMLYRRAMKDKYERAARYPWFPVMSDPPEPTQ